MMLSARIAIKSVRQDMIEGPALVFLLKKIKLVCKKHDTHKSYELSFKRFLWF